MSSYTLQALTSVEQFRTSDSHVMWLQQVLRSPEGKDFFASLRNYCLRSSVDPSNTAGHSYACGLHAGRAEMLTVALMMAEPLTFPKFIESTYPPAEFPGVPE